MNENNVKNDWTKRDIGALWKREGKNQKYLSGYVKVDELGIEREVKIVVFSNKHKNNNDKAPDYRIYVSTPIDANQNDVQNKITTSKVPNKKSASKADVTQTLEENAEEIL